MRDAKDQAWAEQKRLSQKEGKAIWAHRRRPLAPSATLSHPAALLSRDAVRATPTPLMAAPPLLHLRDIALTLGGARLLKGAELAVSRGDRVALVGRNGSGKSTLLKIAAGELAADSGDRFIQPNAKLRYLPQEPDLSGHAHVIDYVLAGLDEEESGHRAHSLLADFGVDETAAPLSLSGGEARRAALARALAPNPDILLLDEPTNHLDLIAIEWLEKTLGDLRAAMVIVSHDKRLLSNLTNQTVWLDRGVSRRLDAGFSSFEAWRDAVLEEEEIAAHKLDRKILDEEHWMRYGVTARRKRNMRRVGELGELRRQSREARRAVGGPDMAASLATPSGSLVIEAENVSKAYGERPIVAEFSTRVLRADRVGIVGANGAGKTTLIRLLTGELTPDSGVVRLGANVQMATLDQGRASLPPVTTLADALTGGGSDYVTVNGARKHVVGYMRDFLFPPEQARTPIGKLSGGERGRLMLARALARASNLLVLDEPTNDLDIETLDLLQELLAAYPGTILIVSHDRDFLDRVATSVIVSEDRGRWGEFAGGYSDMVAQRGHGLVPPVKTSDRSRGAAQKVALAPRADGRRKLSFNQKHALDTLPGKIDSLRAALTKIEAAMAAPDAHARDPAGFLKLSAAHGAKTSELAALEDQWLELEMLREEMEG